MYLSLLLIFAYIVRLTDLVNLSVSWNVAHPFIQRLTRKAAFRAHNHTYPTDVLNLTSILVNIPSVTDHEHAIFDYATHWLQRHNLSVCTHTIDDDHRNILAFYNDGDHDHHDVINQLRVILSTHLDTVPPIKISSSAKPSNDHDEEEAWLDDVTNRLYGRGSVDAKGQAASMMIAMSDLLSSSSSSSSSVTAKHHVGLLLVCSEERGHIGMSAAKHFNLSTDITLINGEPTDSMFASRQKGMIAATISVSGLAAHSGYPHLGLNAIDILMHLLTRLQHETTTTSDGHSATTMNVGMISGGSAPNIVAPSASAVVVWRLGTSTTAVDVMRKISMIAHQVEEEGQQEQQQVSFNDTKERRRRRRIVVSVDKMNDPVSLFVPPRMGARQNVTTVAYNTDIPYYGRGTRFNVLFGAGSIHQAHSVNEYIDVDELRNLPRLYRELTDEMLALYEEDGNANADADGKCNADDDGVGETTEKEKEGDEEEEEEEEEEDNDVDDDDDDDDDIVDSVHDEI